MSASGYMTVSGTYAPWSSPRRGCSATVSVSAINALILWRAPARPGHDTALGKTLGEAAEVVHQRNARLGGSERERRRLPVGRHHQDRGRPGQVTGPGGELARPQLRRPVAVRHVRCTAPASATAHCRPSTPGLLPVPPLSPPQNACRVNYKHSSPCLTPQLSPTVSQYHRRVTTRPLRRRLRHVVRPGATSGDARAPCHSGGSSASRPPR